MGPSPACGVCPCMVLVVLVRYLPLGDFYFLHPTVGMASAPVSTWALRHGGGKPIPPTRAESQRW